MGEGRERWTGAPLLPGRGEPRSIGGSALAAFPSYSGHNRRRSMEMSWPEPVRLRRGDPDP